MLRRAGDPMCEDDIQRHFPSSDVGRLLGGARNVRFVMQDRVRMWEYDTPRAAEDAVLRAVQYGCASVEEIQREVSRRFGTVRRALHTLERQGYVYNAREMGDEDWRVVDSRFN